MKYILSLLLLSVIVALAWAQSEGVNEAAQSEDLDTAAHQYYGGGYRRGGYYNRGIYGGGYRPYYGGGGFYGAGFYGGFSGGFYPRYGHGYGNYYRPYGGYGGYYHG